MAAAAEDPTVRVPGQRTRALVQRLRMRTILSLGAAAIVTILVGRELGLRSDLFLACEVALLLVILVVLHCVLPLVERHDRGASGEEHVGGLLDSMGAQGWLILHGADLGHGDVDHIAIGPGGLFTLETKSHPGPINVRRVHGGAVEQARSQARKVQRIAGAPVEALIVYSEAWVDRPLARRRGVRIVPARLLGDYLARRPAVLEPDDVRLLHGRLTRALSRVESPAGSPAREAVPTG